MVPVTVAWRSTGFVPQASFRQQPMPVRLSQRDEESRARIASVLNQLTA